MSLLYWSKDMVLYSGQYGVCLCLKKKENVFLEGLIMFFSYLTCMSARVQDLYPARCLLLY